MIDQRSSWARKMTSRCPWSIFYCTAVAVVFSALVSSGGSFNVYPFSMARRSTRAVSALSTSAPGARPEPPPRELIEREKARWGLGTARAEERGVNDKGAKNNAKKGGRGGGGGVVGKNKAGARRPRSKEDRGRGPAVLYWRMFNLELPVDVDPGKDHCGVSDELLAAVAGKLGIQGEEAMQETAVVIARKSFDARTHKGADPRFSYTLDIRLDPKTARKLRLRPKQGKLEPSPAGGPTFPVLPSTEASSDPSTAGFSNRANEFSSASLDSEISSGVGSSGATAPTSPASGAVVAGAQPSVVVVGAGPAGLFAALELVEAGVKPIIVERGMPVERRGREIGALFARRILNPESNLCYGEGGAGTWSDGKLTTRIGRNGGNVRKVLETLVQHGAPERILVDGKPHLGTDRLVRILRDMRSFLIERGAIFRFDTKVEGFLTGGGAQRGSIRGLKLADGDEILADRVVLAVGHSARPMYEKLQEAGVGLQAKGIAVGFRIEHPQAMINEIRYGAEIASMVDRGKGKVPVADYRLTQSLGSRVRGAEVEGQEREGGDRSCYSFCMCPGGQVVPTSVDPKEVCVNGMSFSKRDSRWANAALVVSLSPTDVANDVTAFEGGEEGSGPLRGVRWQSTMERRAAEIGGGDLVVPVQRVTDFMAGTAGGDAGLPTSSYRLGVRAGPLHEIYPSYVTEGLREALAAFERRMPGFVCDQALLHGVETRTSSPVQVGRDPTTLECPSMEGLFPTGEGAGYAGGIVSAAVDGILVGQAVAAQIVAAARAERSYS